MKPHPNHQYEPFPGSIACAICDLGEEAHLEFGGALMSSKTPSTISSSNQPVAVPAKLLSPETSAGSSAPVPGNEMVRNPSVATGGAQAVKL